MYYYLLLTVIVLRIKYSLCLLLSVIICAITNFIRWRIVILFIKLQINDIVDFDENYLDNGPVLQHLFSNIKPYLGLCNRL